MTKAGAVTNLNTMSVSQSQITLDWTEAAGEGSYRIQRSAQRHQRLDDSRHGRRQRHDLHRHRPDDQHPILLSRADARRHDGHGDLRRGEPLHADERRHGSGLHHEGLESDGHRLERADRRDRLYRRTLDRRLELHAGLLGNRPDVHRQQRRAHRRVLLPRVGNDLDLAQRLRPRRSSPPRRRRRPFPRAWSASTSAPSAAPEPWPTTAAPTTTRSSPAARISGTRPISAATPTGPTPATFGSIVASRLHGEYRRLGEGRRHGPRIDGHRREGSLDDRQPRAARRSSSIATPPTAYTYAISGPVVSFPYWMELDVAGQHHFRLHLVRRLVRRTTRWSARSP